MDTHDTAENVRLTADALVFARRRDTWHVLMIQRRWEPFTGRWAFPGGHVDPGETFYQAALRELAEETGIKAVAMRQLDVYDRPDRDPRGRYITVAFFTTTTVQVKPTAGDDAAHAAWLPITWLLRNPGSIAFDHAEILTDALAVLTAQETR